MQVGNDGLYVILGLTPKGMHFNHPGVQGFGFPIGVGNDGLFVILGLCFSVILGLDPGIHGFRFPIVVGNDGSQF
ncbi:MAG TPA: hypothetical protein ENO02_09110 [Epsilonproteobacteria bacterium]|nr:hypothetical protein [Campylobacterota bacterium]